MIRRHAGILCGVLPAALFAPATAPGRGLAGLPADDRGTAAGSRAGGS
jgi:hypothetical protein